jgi:hypothetical protein
MNSTINLVNGKLIETKIETIEHEPLVYLENLEAQKADMIAGRDNYLLEVNYNIDEIQSKITSIQNLLK